MNNNNTLVSRRSRKKRGQAISEYLILTALIGVGSIAVVQVLSANLKRKVAQVSEAVRGKATTFEGVKATKKHYKTYDMGDFTDGMIDSGEN